MKNRFRFEKLQVWQEARRLNRTIYRLTRNFPRAELFAMTSQIRRAWVSISSNIAEGSGRNSDRDFGHFLEQAYGSLMEVASIFSSRSMRATPKKLIWNRFLTNWNAWPSALPHLIVL
jgi:four helix bundle protein